MNESQVQLVPGLYEIVYQYKDGQPILLDKSDEPVTPQGIVEKERVRVNDDQWVAVGGRVLLNQTPGDPGKGPYDITDLLP